MFCLSLIFFFWRPALIESDAEGIGGSGFVECIREHIIAVCTFKKKNTFRMFLVEFLILICVLILGLAMPANRRAIHCC
jgi:hypothetical protein